MTDTNRKMPPVPLIALVGWLVPGCGYFLIGQKGRALVSGLTIAILFILGLFIGGVRVVDVPGYDIYGDIKHPDNRDTNPPSIQINPVGEVLSKPWFIAQIMNGPICVISSYASLQVARNGIPPSTSRVFDIGTLYTAVAGMLNLMVMIDAAYRASRPVQSGASS